MVVPTITLNNNVKMPLEGYGVFTITDFEECKQSVLQALNAGYRLIDTAQIYYNEEAVGAAIKESGIPREELFVTTKIWVPNFGEGKTYASLQTSLKRLGLDYIDLILLHMPYGDYYGAYRDLQKAQTDGLARAIGVSNFYGNHYADLVHFMDVIPAVNQVEAHVFSQRKDLQALMAKYGTVMEAWGPLAQGKNDIFSHPLLTEIGEKYGKTPAQVALRYLTQNDVVIIPKTLSPERMASNIDIWDFSLSTDDMKKIAKLDTGQPLVANHNDGQFVEGFMSYIDNNPNA